MLTAVLGCAASPQAILPMYRAAFVVHACVAALLPSAAEAAAIGRFGGPYVGGALRAGDAEQVQREWAQERFEKPMRLRIGEDSGDGLEVARLGQWLRERRPVVQLERDCVRSCARDLLMAGRGWLADRGVLIAFSSMDDWPLLLKQALDEGQLFADDGGLGTEVKARFVAQYRPLWERAQAVKDLRDRTPGLPDAAQRFLDQLTRPTAASKVTFSGGEGSFSMQHSVLGCMAWLPDAQGLKQLGVDLPTYQPPPLAEAAKRLKLPAERIYVGAMPDAPPTQPLCQGAPVDLGTQRL